MPFVRLADVVFHYRDQGNPTGPVITLVNSLGTDARIWSDVVDGLSADYRVITYDKRGHGLSDAPEADYTIEDHLGDLDALLRHLKVDRLVLAGVSVGGLIAQGFAIRHPERLAGLILCDTAAKIGDVSLWNERIAAVRQGGMAALADAVMTRWFTEDFRCGQPDQLQGWRNMLLRAPVAGYVGTCATLRDTDLRTQLGRINAPALVVVGDQDLATPPALVRETAEAIRGSRFEVIADSGHIPSIDQPAALLRLMLAFLQEVGHG